MIVPARGSRPSRKIAGLCQKAPVGPRRRPRRGTGWLGLEPLEGRTLLAANLTITPITWNVVGLDSNNVNAGPNQYLIGARITNTGDAAATGVRSGFVFDSSNANINLDGPSSQGVRTLAPGASADVYYNAV